MATVASTSNQAAAVTDEAKSLLLGQLTLLATLSGHKDRVWCAAWSPNGKALATSSGDTTVRIWGPEGASDQWVCKHVLDGIHTRTVRCVAWAPDGKRLATCGFDGITAVWELQNGEFECVAQLEGHENEVKAVAWSASGALLATCSRDKSVWIWEGGADNEFECSSVLHGHSQDVKHVLWHPTEELLVSSSYDDTLKLWIEEDDDWHCSETLQGHDSTVWHVAFDSKGQRLVSCSDDTSLIFWERKAVDQSGDLASAAPGLSPQLRRYQQIQRIPRAHTRTIFCVDWSPASGLIATAAADDAVHIYAENPDVSSRSTHPFARIGSQTKAHDADVNGVSWHPSDPTLLASVGDDHAVKLWRWTSTAGAGSDSSKGGAAAGAGASAMDLK